VAQDSLAISSLEKLGGIVIPQARAAETITDEKTGIMKRSSRRTDHRYLEKSKIGKSSRKQAHREAEESGASLQ
jgi:hypothetical protein